MNKFFNYVGQRAPTALTIAGCAGVMTTAVLTGVATYKACELVKPKDLKQAFKDEETRKEIVKCYIPPAISAAATIASVISANYIQYRKNSLIAGALAMTSKAYLNYKKKVKEIDPDLDIEATTSIAKEQYESKKIWVDDNSEDVLFFESFSQRFFVSTWANVYAAFYHINRNFRLRAWVDMNEIFEFLGLSEFYIGSKYGFDEDKMWTDGLVPMIDFEPIKAKTEDGQEYYIIDYGFGLERFDNWDDETDINER